MVGIDKGETKLTKNRKYIKIRGANERNLKCIDVDIPRDGSCCSDRTVRFRQVFACVRYDLCGGTAALCGVFVFYAGTVITGQMEKPDVESIEGLPPAISIDQKSTNRNPRSTVGTVTEIVIIFDCCVHIGIPHCQVDVAIEKQTIDQMVDAVMKLPERTRIRNPCAGCARA